MITLPSAITIKEFIFNGVTQAEYTLGPEIKYSVIYSNDGKFAKAIIGKFPAITLWSGKEYDDAGQFTDSDTEARLLEVIGNDPSAFFNGLNEKLVIKQPAANKSAPIPPPKFRKS